MTTAASAASPNANLLAYAGVLLIVTGDRLDCIGSDGDNLVDGVVRGTNGTPGQILIPPRPVLDLLAHVDSAVTVDVEATELGELRVSGPGFPAYTFRPLIATYTLPPTGKDRQQPVNLARLGAAVNAVEPACDKKWRAVEVVSTDAALTVQATDGYRIHSVRLPGGGFGEYRQGLPVDVLKRAARGEISKASFDPVHKTLRFAGPKVVVVANPLALSLPPVEKLLELEAAVEVELPVPELIRRLNRIGSIARNAVQVEIKSGKLSMSVVEKEVGTGTESVAVNSKDEARFVVGRGYFTEALSAHLIHKNPQPVTLGYTAPMAPLTLRSASDVTVTTVVQPMRP